MSAEINTPECKHPSSCPATVAPWNSSRWADYFQTNRANLASIPWGDGVSLTGGQASALTQSLQQFQLGESGEGKHLIDCARRFAEHSGDQAYVTAVCRFIAEEQRHARDLGRVLDLAGIPRIKNSWPDTVFRWLRRSAGLELSVAVLVTAEVIAKVYYASIREATTSQVLRRLCDQILYDEQEHVRFQSERLAILRCGRRNWAVAIGHGLHRAFFAGTCVVVWWKHRTAFKAGGCGLIDFVRAAWEDLEAAIRQMDPRQYAPIKGGAAPTRHPSPWHATSPHFGGFRNR